MDDYKKYDIIDHIYIDVHGKRGNDGNDGSNSSDTNNGRVGCGGGGAGSSGLPAGAIIIRNFHLVQISKSNCNLFSGEPGNNGSNGKFRYCSDVGILDEVEPIAAKILPNGFFDK